MKKFPILLAFTLLTFVVAALRADTIPTWAQSYGFGSYDRYGQPTNDNTYGSGLDLPSEIAAMPDGGVVVAGQLSLSELQYPVSDGRSSAFRDAGIVRYDAKGAVVWQQLLRLPGNNPDDHTHVMLVRSDGAGNIFICGQNSLSTGASYPFVAKFSADGGLVWQNGLNTVLETEIVYGSPRNDPYGVNEYKTMDLTSDGGVVVGSGVYSAGNGHVDPIIVKFNADGSLAFHRIYANQYNQYSDVHSVCERPGGNGYAVLLAADGANGTVVLLTDSAGNPVFERTFNGGDGAEQSGGDAKFITRSADGGFLYLSKQGTTVHKLGADLSTIWIQHLSNFYGAKVLTPTADGGCIVGGSLAEAAFKSGGNGAQSALLLTLNGSGTLQGAHLLGGPGAAGGSEGTNQPGGAEGTPTVPCVTADGGVAFTISTYSYYTGSPYKADWWIVKTDGNGKVLGFGDTMTDAPLAFFAEAPPTEQASFVSSNYGPGLNNDAGATANAGPAFVQEDLGNNTGINKPTIKNQTTVPIPPPTHGGLSGITFSVDESTDPTPGLADSVLRFRAVQGGKPAGLLVKVQTSTNGGVSWNDLGDATGGLMSYASRLSAYILNSTNYPAVNNVYFRSIAKGQGYGERASAMVGPFDLTSATPHLGGPLLFVTTNGEVNAIRFGVKQSSIPSGIALRIQTSQTPADEQSWGDAPIGSHGNMIQDTTTPDLNQFYLGTDNYTTSEGVYFRAVATAPGYYNSLSFPYGPFTFVNDPAATVTIQINGVNTSANDIDNPYLLSSGAFNIQASASSGRMLKWIKLLYDGNVVAEFDNGATHGSLDYNSQISGDHIVEAYATDDLGVTGVAAPIHVRKMPSDPGKLYLMTNSGNWNTASNWVDIQGNPGVPGPNDFAVVSTFSPTLTSDVTVRAMSLNGGTFTGAHTLTVTSFCTIADGVIKSNLNIPAGATCELLNDTDVTLTGTLTYAGTMRLHGKGGIGGIRSGSSQAFNGVGPQPDGFFDFVGGIINGVGKFIADLSSGGRRGSKASAAPQTTTAPEKRTVAAASVNIAAGSVISVPAPSAALITQDGGGLITQDGGGLVAQGGGNLVAQGGGNLVAQGGGNLVAQGGGNLVAQGGGNLVAQGGGNLIATGGGNLVAQGGGNLVAQGGGNAPNRSHSLSTRTPASATSAGISLSGGEIELSGFTIYGSVALDGGTLSGSGVILGDLANNSGYLSPGAMALFGNFAQASVGILTFESGGATPDLFDQLQVSGTASLGGNLQVRLINGYRPDTADTFNPLGYSSASGAFDSVSSNAQVTVNADGLLISTDPNIPSPTPPPTPTPVPTPTPSPTASPSPTATPVPTATPTPTATVSPTATPHPSATPTATPTPSPTATPSATPASGQPLNISTRLRVLQDDKVMIGGFIITGPAGSTKAVLIRGEGPSLAGAGLSGVLSDPLLELHKADGSVVINDNWVDAPNQERIPSGFAPTNNKESLIIADLAPGNYTAIEKGAHGEIGIGLVEIYDLDGKSNIALANISTRGFVDTGDNVMIGGFIVGGGKPATILVRATGPSLTKAGLSGVLEDPVLELHDSNGNVTTNDNWRETQEAEIIASTVAPAEDKEPAILATLVPGNYTAIVRGKDNSTGIAVVEAYRIK